MPQQLAQELLKDHIFLQKGSVSHNHLVRQQHFSLLQRTWRQVFCLQSQHRADLHSFLCPSPVPVWLWAFLRLHCRISLLLPSFFLNAHLRSKHTLIAMLPSSSTTFLWARCGPLQDHPSYHAKCMGKNLRSHKNLTRHGSNTLTLSCYRLNSFNTGLTAGSLGFVTLFPTPFLLLLNQVSRSLCQRQFECLEGLEVLYLLIYPKFWGLISSAVAQYYPGKPCSPEARVTLFDIPLSVGVQQVANN